MSDIADIHHDSGNVEWFTPMEIIEAARRTMGGISLDPFSCKEANEVVRARHIFTKADDGLKQDWRANVWLTWDEASERFVACPDRLQKSAPVAKTNYLEVLHTLLCAETGLVDFLLSAKVAWPSKAMNDTRHDEDRPPISDTGGRILQVFSDALAARLNTQQPSNISTRNPDASTTSGRGVAGACANTLRSSDENSDSTRKDTPGSWRPTDATTVAKKGKRQKELTGQYPMPDVGSATSGDLLSGTRECGSHASADGISDARIAELEKANSPKNILSLSPAPNSPALSPKICFPVASRVIADGAVLLRNGWSVSWITSKVSETTLCSFRLRIPSQVFMNHPFSKGMNPLCINKALTEFESGRAKQLCCITYASTTERWFRPLMQFPQCFLHKRTAFRTPEGETVSGAKKGCAITYMGPNLDRFAAEFAPFGTIKIAYKTARDFI